ncbi:Putative aminotransferase/cysteine desulfhydrase [Mycobacteroides abscessus]|uniref:Aminotransferase n=4 Tax=Mycobacteroides abscessus TaxID=36809 RepID=A0A829HPX0_9MYCO|nr:cysteine desulfurase family protein [Mycobacteroides abscessus]AFN64703.1 aminotransferase [Mycobacteroides abscessus subsp. massiliense str. GO 06]AMU28338.1 aminotransferase [Mycobacteroides abscessus]AMU37967.1 aminotransferase [Mycobacteroides abscessus]AMU43010.1 aminotransferase [Mycobacteroides abscessus]AMU63041.1 aminotransferase [Mycobacteroides abscessus]
MSAPSQVLNPPTQVAPTEIYLDYAATAPLHPRAAQAVLDGHQLVGNPSSRHGAGRDAADALAVARKTVARLLGADAEEVVLTSGGSEANTLALWGTFAAVGFRGHLVTSSIEHPAVLANAHALRDLGVQVTLVDPAPSGHIGSADVARALRPDTTLVSVMHANNETGAIQPVWEIADIARQSGVAFHTDAVHTAGKLDLTVVGATMMSVSAHKFGGPRGMGALLVRSGHRLLPVTRGGPQENRLRAGTENVPGALGMAAAADVCLRTVETGYRLGMRKRREQLIDGLRAVGGVHLNVTEPVLEETVSVRFDGVRADTLADHLDMHGIYVSTGSACHAGEDTVSHVLRAMCLTEDQARGTVRFSLGPGVSPADVDTVVAVTVQAVHRLRATAGGMIR